MCYVETVNAISLWNKTKKIINSKLKSEMYIFINKI